MDNLENPISTQSEAGDLQAQFESLRHLIVSILILLIIVSGTFTIYLLRQWRSTTTDLAIYGPQVKQVMAEYTRISVPMNEFVKQLVEYGRTHPDFAPVLSKYGIKPGAPAPALGPTSSAAGKNP
jgi:hypothetical protein